MKPSEMVCQQIQELIMGGWRELTLLFLGGFTIQVLWCFWSSFWGFWFKSYDL